MAQTRPSENCPIGKSFSHFSKCFLKYASTELQPIMLYLSRAQSAITELVLQNAVLYTHTHTHTHTQHSCYISCTKHRVQLKPALNINQRCRCFFKQPILFRFRASPCSYENKLIYLSQSNSAPVRARAPSIALSVL